MVQTIKTPNIKWFAFGAALSGWQAATRFPRQSNARNRASLTPLLYRLTNVLVAQKSVSVEIEGSSMYFIQWNIHEHIDKHDLTKSIEMCCLEGIRGTTAEVPLSNLHEALNQGLVGWNKKENAEKRLAHRKSLGEVSVKLVIL
jgi:hypothetical protein